MDRQPQDERTNLDYVMQTSHKRPNTIAEVQFEGTLAQRMIHNLEEQKAENKGKIRSQKQKITELKRKVTTLEENCNCKRKVQREANSCESTDIIEQDKNKAMLEIKIAEHQKYIEELSKEKALDLAKIEQLTFQLNESN